jgi:hypothetical protein
LNQPQLILTIALKKPRDLSLLISFCRIEKRKSSKKFLKSWMTLVTENFQLKKFRLDSKKSLERKFLKKKLRKLLKKLIWIQMVTLIGKIL